MAIKYRMVLIAGKKRLYWTDDDLNWYWIGKRKPPRESNK